MPKKERGLIQYDKIYQNIGAVLIKSDKGLIKDIL